MSHCLFPNVLDEAKSKGIDIQPKYIPAEVFDNRAVEFENEWQSFRTKKDRSLELTSAARDVAKDKKRVKIAVKVVDIFGNDTMTIVDVAVGGKK